MSKKKISWGTHFIELLVVVIGISIAFGLERWSNEQKQSELEIDYLNSLKSDLQKDVADIDLALDSTRAILRTVGETFRLTFSDAPLSSFDTKHITYSYTPPYFRMQDGTYQTLINTGEINVLSDFELKTALINHYNLEYADLEQIDSKVQNLVDNIIYPYMIKNITFTMESGVASIAPLKTNEAINMLGSYINFLGQTRGEAYTKYKANCNMLIELIDEQLEKLGS